MSQSSGATTISRCSDLQDFLCALRRSGRISNEEYCSGMSLLRQYVQSQSVDHDLMRIDKPTSQPQSVSTVFNTVELAEEIFSYLAPADLLKGVLPSCHTFQEIVDTTPVLKKKLFRRADWQSELELPHIRNVHYSVKYGYVEVLIIDAGRTLRSSSTLRQMFLTQPPPRSAQIFYECSCTTRDAGRVKAPTGLTFAQISWALDQHLEQSQTNSERSRRCQCDDVREARLIWKIRANQDDSP